MEHIPTFPRESSFEEILSFTSASQVAIWLQNLALFRKDYSLLFTVLCQAVHAGKDVVDIHDQFVAYEKKALELQGTSEEYYKLLLSMRPVNWNQQAHLQEFGFLTETLQLKDTWRTIILNATTVTETISLENVTHIKSLREMLGDEYE